MTHDGTEFVSGSQLRCGAMRAWLFILSSAKAAEWVLEHERLALRVNVSTSEIESGDKVAIYLTRGAFGNPTADRSSVIALTTVTGRPARRRFVVEGIQCAWSVPIRVATSVPTRAGLAFKPLIPRLGFIKKKHAWSAYMRRTLIGLTAHDYEVIASSLRTHVQRQG